MMWVLIGYTEGEYRVGPIEGGFIDFTTFDLLRGSENVVEKINKN